MERQTDTLDDPETVHMSVKWDHQCLFVRVVRTLWVLIVVKWVAASSPL